MQELGFRFAEVRVSGGFGVGGIFDCRANGIRFFSEYRRKQFSEDPNNHAGNDGKVDPLEDFRGAPDSRVVGFVGGTQRDRRKERHHDNTCQNKAISPHRTSLAGAPGRSGPSRIRRAISAESSATVAWTSRRAAASSAATRTLAAVTSPEALLRASLICAARSSRTLRRAASCSAYTPRRACARAS